MGFGQVDRARGVGGVQAKPAVPAAGFDRLEQRVELLSGEGFVGLVGGGQVGVHSADADAPFSAGGLDERGGGIGQDAGTPHARVDFHVDVRDRADLVGDAGQRDEFRRADDGHRHAFGDQPGQRVEKLLAVGVGTGREKHQQGPLVAEIPQGQGFFGVGDRQPVGVLTQQAQQARQAVAVAVGLDDRTEFRRRGNALAQQANIVFDRRCRYVGGKIAFHMREPADVPSSARPSVYHACGPAKHRLPENLHENSRGHSPGKNARPLLCLSRKLGLFPLTDDRRMKRQPVGTNVRCGDGTSCRHRKQHLPKADQYLSFAAGFDIAIRTTNRKGIQMLGGFTDLSAEFFSEILTRRSRQEILVHSVKQIDYADSPDNIRGATGLRKLELSTSAGPVGMMVKNLSLARKREAEVWQFLSQAGDMPIPEVYHVELDSRQGRYGVVTEFLAPLDEVSDWSPEVCSLVGAALARLHRRWWGKIDEAPDFLPVPRQAAETHAEGVARRFIDRLSEADRAELYTVVPDVFGLFVSLLRMPPEFFSEPTDMPRTIIHGSLDTSEVLFRPAGKTIEPVLIDWEAARCGRCTEDLAGLLNSLPADTRAAGRDAMVGAYVETLSQANVGIHVEYPQQRIDSRRIMMAARDPPGMCRAYIERKDDPQHRQWSRWFLDRAGRDVPELRKLLKQRSK